MRNGRAYGIWLLITYIVMAGICAYLNLFSTGQSGGLANLIVNIAMFIIVGVILLTCYIGSFRPTLAAVRELESVSEKIEDDAKHTHGFLWERYREEKEELFREETLREEFKAYRYEMDRILHSDNAYYKCDIEDYINYDLIDSMIKRNRMNQVAGVMTGLGILGTFIGLSLGLQSFNTGSTAELTNSIDPLMAGIKVAFHTSIYGMVFSLVFNWVYKRFLDDADNTVRNFIATYKKYVMPDTTPDGTNRFLELQQQQTAAVRELSNTVTHLLSDGLRQILDPQFARMNDTITGFANMATKNQMDQLAVVVNAFVSEMNRSLDNMFDKLSNTMDNTLAVQKENEKQMEEMFSRNVTAADNIGSIAEMTGDLTDTLKQYVEKVGEYQVQMNDTVGLLNKYQKSINDSVAMSGASMREQSAMLNDLHDTVMSLPDDVNETFSIINQNLQTIERHFEDTIGQMQQVLSQMQQLLSQTSGTIDFSYRNVEQSFIRTAKSIEELAGFMQRLEEYYTGG
ncbi:MAG: MotA/TolQ/ExbB proton channel family protein [Lachnospiraceae bacterium]|nr:MotA/TolQ/ExbB proton channel family protein [Lachnospiraceae bacterium]